MAGNELDPDGTAIVSTTAEAVQAASEARRREMRALADRMTQGIVRAAVLDSIDETPPPPPDVDFEAWLSQRYECD
jgi:hypothetical protein